MNDDNKDNDRRSLSSRLGNGSKRTRREHEETAMDMHTTIKQITRRGGVGGNDGDDDGHDDDDDDDDNDDDGRCGWQDGHHRMRKQTQQSNRSQKRGGGDSGDGSDDDETTTMKPRSDRGCGGGEWRAAATAVAVATRG